jgi:hypothetical protein
LLRGLGVVFRGLDGAGDERVPAIGADPVAVPHDLLHREALLQLDTSRHGGVDEDLIEHKTPRAVCLGNARCCRRSVRQGEGAKVNGERCDGRAVRGQDLIQ